MLVIRIAGRVTERAADMQEFQERMLCLANAALGRGDAIVFDCSLLEDIRGALRALMLLRKAAGEQAKLAVASLQPFIRERYEIVRFDRLIPAYDTVQDALAALR